MAKNILADKILIIDFGSQYTQLIARRVREIGVYCEIYSHQSNLKSIKEFDANGIILSGGPETVKQKGSPKVPNGIFDLDIPILGICYGMQTITKQLGGKVELANKREFGHADLKISNQGGGLFKNIKDKTTSVWMSHGDHVTKLPKGFKVIEQALSAEEWYWCKYSYTDRDGNDKINIDHTRIRWKPWEYYFSETDMDPITQEEMEDYVTNGSLTSNDTDRAFVLAREWKEMQGIKLR